MRGGLQLRLEGYSKRFTRLTVTPLPDDVVETLVVIPDQFREGSGSAKGLELFTRYERGRSGLTASYALTKVEREVDGFRFTPRFERRHTMDLSGFAGWGRAGQLTSRLVVASGQSYIPVVGLTERLRYDPVRGTFTPDYSSGQLVLGDHNSARLPGYLRLDVGARRSYERRWFGQPGTITPYLSVLNVLNTPNVLFASPESSAWEGTRSGLYPAAPDLSDGGGRMEVLMRTWALALVVGMVGIAGCEFVRPPTQIDLRRDRPDRCVRRLRQRRPGAASGHTGPPGCGNGISGGESVGWIGPTRLV